MRSVIEAVASLRPEGLREFNAYSYLTLKGTSILCYKLLGRVEACGVARAGRVEPEELKSQLLREVSKNSNAIFQAVSTQINRLLDEVREAFKANRYRVKECMVRSIGRVVMGVGQHPGKVPFEVGLSLDPLLGVPFIPGSTLKGAFRHALVSLSSERAFGGCDENLANELFGHVGGMGLVGVTDAYPVRIDERMFEPDVIAPHYPHAKTELDVQPVPVTFLTVAPGVEFKFYIYYKDEVVKHVFEGDLESAVKRGVDPLGLLGCIDKAVLYALARGVGAKTSIGYSRFTLVKYVNV